MPQAVAELRTCLAPLEPNSLSHIPQLSLSQGQKSPSILLQFVLHKVTMTPFSHVGKMNPFRDFFRNWS